MTWGKIARSAAAVALAGGVVAGGAAASAQAVPPPCGFYEVGGGFLNDDMYNHCGDHPVWVTMVGLGLYNQYTACLAPGVHDLNEIFNNPVLDAYSEGEPCSDPE